MILRRFAIFHLQLPVHTAVATAFYTRPQSCFARTSDHTVERRVTPTISEQLFVIFFVQLFMNECTHDLGTDKRTHISTIRPSASAKLTPIGQTKRKKNKFLGHSLLTSLLIVSLTFHLQISVN